MNTPSDISDNQQQQQQQQQQTMSNDEIEKKKEEREKLIRMNQERIKIEAINMVCRQTDYDEETAKSAETLPLHPPIIRSRMRKTKTMN